MNSAIDRRELTFKGLAGLLGGALGWIPVEITNHNHSLTQAQTASELWAGFIAMAILSGLIGGLVNAAEEHSFEWTHAVKFRLGVGFGVCFVLGLVANKLSNSAFNAILSAGGWGINHPGSMVYLIAARVIGWTMMGAMLGAGVGLAGLSLKNPARSVANIVKGAAGGWIGGFIGGFSFDLIGAFSSTGLASRLIGFSVLGLLIGLFIGLVQELTKSAWLTVEAGRLRGRQFRLESMTTTVGRAEENRVGLFGDPKVQPRHAVIESRGAGYSIRNLAIQDGTFVNGGRIETADLHDGDRVRIGDYELGFHLRQGSDTQRSSLWPRPAAAPPPTESPAPAVQGAGAHAPTSTADNGGAPYLVNADGQHFALKSAQPTRLGRALDNDIVLDDASVSRHHATIEAVNGRFKLKDLASQNGTWLRGQRVTEADLANGDGLKFGDVMFTFHA